MPKVRGCTRGHGPCTHPGCTVKKAAYNFVGMLLGIMCALHALPGMKNVVDKLCEHCNMQRARLGDLETRKLTACAKCNKKHNLGLSYIHGLCQHCNKTVASLGDPKTGKMTACAKCNDEKKLGLSHVHGMCRHCNEKQAKVGDPATGKVTACASCNLRHVPSLLREGRMCGRPFDR